MIISIPVYTYTWQLIKLPFELFFSLTENFQTTFVRKTPTSTFFFFFESDRIFPPKKLIRQVTLGMSPSWWVSVLMTCSTPSGVCSHLRGFAAFVYTQKVCEMLQYQGLSQDFHHRMSKLGFQELRVSKIPD